MSEAKTEALKKKLGEKDGVCKKCGKHHAHPIHHNKAHPKYHKHESNEAPSTEKGDEKEGREEAAEEGEKYEAKDKYSFGKK